MIKSIYTTDGNELTLEEKKCTLETLERAKKISHRLQKTQFVMITFKENKMLIKDNISGKAIN